MEGRNLRNSKNFDFKVIHFSTGHTGGAGLAARRLNWELNNSGISSSFYALDSSEYIPTEKENIISRNISSKLSGAISTLISSFISNKSFFSLFSMNALPEDLVLKIAEPKDTILHFHNWFNLSNQREILNLASRGFPIVITMHDQRFMTGGCHYAFSCLGLNTGCKKCPSIPSFIDWIPGVSSRLIAKKLATKKGNIAFIAPSKWILDEAKGSLLLSEQKIYFITNTLGNFLSVDTLVPINAQYKTNLVLGIASMDTKSYIKGGDIASKLAMVAKKKGLPIEFLLMKDVVTGENLFNDFWRKIDYLFVPSRADNSPNVIHEAKKLGIPVIATKIGGITELLTEGFDLGIEIEDLNVDHIIKLLTKVKDYENNENGRGKMRDNFSNYTSDSLLKHIELYESLIEL